MADPSFALHLRLLPLHALLAEVRLLERAGHHGVEQLVLGSAPAHTRWDGMGPKHPSPSPVYNSNI